MFHDHEVNTMYKITFGDDADRNLDFQMALKNAKDEEEKKYLRVVHSMKDLMVPANGLIRFPISTGITGKVFSEQTPLFFNNLNQRNNPLFQADIDNTNSIEKIKNLAFFSMARESGSCIGVIQLYNKLKPIIKQDIKKMEAISLFFGGCVYNIEAITKKVTTTIAVQLEAPKTLEFLEGQEQWHQALLMDWNNVGRPAQNIKDVVADNEEMHKYY